VCRVIAKSEVDYDEDAFRITFKDGEIIEAGARHEWYGEWYSTSNALKAGVASDISVKVALEGDKEFNQSIKALPSQ
jgi:hypothetical protein